MFRIPNLLILSALVVVVLAACSDDSGSTPTVAPTTTLSATTSSVPVENSTTTDPSVTTTTLSLDDLHLRLVEVGSGFVAPVLLVADPDGGEDLVVEQQGTVSRVGSHQPVLDISGDVDFSGERGLLGLAFHPEFTVNRLAYVNYTDGDGTTVIEQFVVGPDGLFDMASRNVLLRIGQPAPNHNGGMIAFGPNGYLWIGMGDGGASNDKFQTAQDSQSLLGAMLRISVDGSDSYAVPADNPFADGDGGAPEVWATGVRNPWRFAFDGSDVWIADVGQGQIEEVNVADASAGGLNYGWSVMEGTQCFNADSCDSAPFVVPVTEYTHDDGCSITGGYVYRGPSIPELSGHYFYSDFCSGILRSIHPDDGDRDWTQDVGSVPGPTGFGIGGDGELYISSQGGQIFRLERAG